MSSSTSQPNQLKETLPLSFSNSNHRQGLVEAGKILLEDFKSDTGDLNALRGAVKCLEDSLAGAEDQVEGPDNAEIGSLLSESLVTLCMLTDEISDVVAASNFLQKWADVLSDTNEKKASVLHPLGISLWIAYTKTDNLEFLERSTQALKTSISLKTLQKPDLPRDGHATSVSEQLFNLGIKLEELFDALPSKVTLNMMLMYLTASLRLHSEDGQSKLATMKRLAHTFIIGYDFMKEGRYLDKAIELYRDYLKMLPENVSESEHDRLNMTLDLTRWIWWRFQESAGPLDLDEVITLGTELQKDPQWNETAYLAEMCTLGRALGKRFQSTKKDGDASAAFSVLQQAYNHLHDDQERIVCLLWLSQSLVLCLEDENGSDDLNLDQVDRWRNIVQTCSDSEMKYDCLSAIAQSLRLRSTRSLMFIDLAVDTQSQVLDTCGEDVQKLRIEIMALTACRLIRYVMRHEEEDFDFISTTLEKFAVDTPDFEEPLLRKWRFSLSFLLMAEKYQKDANPLHLRKSIAALKALDQLSSDDEIEITTSNQRVQILINLLKAVVDLFDKSLSEEDFDGAILLSKLLVSEPMCGKRWKAFALFKSFTVRYRRFQGSEDPDQLSIIIQELRSARDMCPEEDPLRCSILLALSENLKEQYTYNNFESMSDLQEAISSGEEALGGLSGPQKDYQSILLLALRHFKAEHTYSLTDVNSAVEAAQELRERSNLSEDYHKLATVTLAASLLLRYGICLNVDDLKRAAFILTDDKGQISSIGGADSLSDLARNTLAWAILKGCRRQFWPQLVDFAIEILQKTISIVSSDFVNRADAMTMLGIAYDIKGDYRSALKHLQDALKENEKIPIFKPGNSAFVHMNIANFALQEYDRSHQLPELALALDSARIANATCAKGSQLEGRTLLALGMAFKRMHQRGQHDDLFSKARDTLDTIIQAKQASPFDRLHAIYEVIYLHIAAKDWARGLKALEVASEILPYVSLLSDNRQEQVAKLGIYPEFPALFCSIKLQMMKTDDSPYDALQNLELLRGLVAGGVIGFREDVEELKQKDQGLYDEFKQLQNELSGSAMACQDVMNASKEKLFSPRLLQATERFQILQTKIRKIEGLGNFQKAPSLANLKALANKGPIVVYNVSSIRSDAFLVTTEGIELVKLPSLTEEILLDMTRRFAKVVSTLGRENIPTSNEEFEGFLAWTWRNVVKPVMKKLNLLEPHSDPLPRIWWVPSGPLVLAPIHAAGYYHQKSTANTMSCAVSSYTTSLKALCYARRHKAFLGSMDPCMLAVGVASISGRPDLDLPWVEREMQMVKSVVEHKVRFHRLEDPTPTKVLEALGKYDMAHFSCHGVVNLEMPMNSRLVLSAGKKGCLSVADLVNCKLDKSQLAVVSACCTSQVSNPNLYHESVHLVSGFALAGFIHVVGSLWKVHDRISAKFNSFFYESLLAALNPDPAMAVDHEIIARAYHSAVLKLKESEDYYESLSIMWATHIHFGA